MKRVVIGLSGGVDSSVAALLLKEKGYDVIGIFMRNWHDDSVILDDECPWIEDSNDAILVAEKIGIPFQVIDLSKEYKERIVDYMFKEYQEGRTPNPDVLCNREIKFDLFLKAALQLNADYIATGHYCQKDSIQSTEGNEIHQLLAGADQNKDQSYFLCQLNQEQLSKALFPIGHLQKSEVRRIAKKNGLATAEKKDSQGLCFIGKVKLPVFLQQELEPKQGKVKEIARDSIYIKPLTEKYGFGFTDEELEEISSETNFKGLSPETIGTHPGAHYFTVGQRKGLNIGGKKLPLFILGTDTKENILYVGQGEDHQGLYRNALKIKNEDISWLRTDMTLKEGEKKEYSVRIRYRQELRKATLLKKTGGLYIVFPTPEKSIAKGQFAAWYIDDELIGSGAIS
ncbi:MAG: tRNA 2-thiouridine(34) synthase MnmA [Flavobacteriales bacterium]|jgi:tRNA-specific 2-thiouridylase